MIKFDVKNRFSGEVQFTAEIDCDENSSTSLKTRLSVLWAIKNNANLSYSNLSGADLSDANLRYANLRDADFSGANLRYADLTIIQTNIWTIYIQKKHIRIGCEYHTVNEWLGFDHETISKMSSEALPWWKKWKPVIELTLKAMEN